MLNAVIAALGPGIATISISFLTAELTSRVPGSEIEGVPASETIPQFSPEFILSTISSIFLFSFLALVTTNGF